MAYILWLEDNPELFDADLLSLRMAGHHVEQVTTASDGYRELKEPKDDAECDFVFLDIVLPPGEPNVFAESIVDDRRGIELLKKLAADGVTALPPIIIISAVAMSLDLDKMREELPDDYAILDLLYKPVDIDKVLELMKR